MFKDQLITVDELKHAEQLISQGKIAEAYQDIELFLSKKPSDPKVRLIGKLHQTDLLLKMRAFPKAIESSNEVLSVCQEQEFLLLEVDAYIAKAKGLWNLARFDEACHVIDQAEERLSDITEEPSDALILRKAAFASLRGSSYLQMGRMDEAVEKLSQSIAFSEQIDDKWVLVTALNNIGTVHWVRGDLDQALASFKRGVKLTEESTNKWDMTWLLNSLGLTYFAKGDFDSALQNIQQALALSEEINRIETAVISLSLLIALTVAQGSLDQAGTYNQQLQQINMQVKDKGISQGSRVANAIFLKASSRMRDKVEAQKILQQVVEEEVIHYQITAIAILNLCELLLEELQAYGDVAVLKEAQALINRLYFEAQKRHSYPFIIETLILQSKMALVDGDLTAAFKFLDQATLITEEKNLKLWAERVQAQTQQLQDHYDKWQTLIQRNVSLQTRLEQTLVADYLKEVQRQIAFMS